MFDENLLKLALLYSIPLACYGFYQHKCRQAARQKAAEQAATRPAFRYQQIQAQLDAVQQKRERIEELNRLITNLQGQAGQTDRQNGDKTNRGAVAETACIREMMQHAGL